MIPLFSQLQSSTFDLAVEAQVDALVHEVEAGGALEVVCHFLLGFGSNMFRMLTHDFEFTRTT